MVIQLIRNTAASFVYGIGVVLGAFGLAFAYFVSCVVELGDWISGDTSDT
jgi:hypothetical protein